MKYVRRWTEVFGTFWNLESCLGNVIEKGIVMIRVGASL